MTFRSCNKNFSKQLKFKETKELHAFQLNELRLHQLSKEYESEITLKHNLLSKASYIQETLAQICILMENGESAIINILSKVTDQLEKISNYDDSILSIRQRTESNRIDLEDILLDIQAVQGNIIVDKNELEKKVNITKPIYCFYLLIYKLKMKLKKINQM